jgi:protein-S-isoprenylcysteine O-methyltransferase Ste14
VLLGVPGALFGGLAAVLNAIAGAPDLASPVRNGALMPPEVAGMTTMVSLAFPPAVAVIGSIPVVLVRETVASGGHPLSTALRSAIALTVLLIIGAWWVRSRPAFKAWWAKTQQEAGQMRKQAAGGT